MKIKKPKSPTTGLALGALSILAAAGCSVSPGSQNNSTPEVKTATAQVERTTTRLVDESGDGKIKLYETKMAPADIEFTRNAYKEIALSDYPVRSSYGANLRHMPKVEKFANTVFVDPTLYIYDSNQGGSIYRDNGDGTTSITFNGVFIDALERRAPNPDRSTDISVPDANLIRNADALKSEVEMGGKTLAFLPGCLERVEILVEGNAYRAAPNLQGVELCGLQNRPLVFSARLPNRYAGDLFSLLEKGLVQVNVYYQVGVPFSPRSMTVTFDKQMFFHELQAKLKYDDKIYTDIEIETAIRELSQGQKFAVIYHGELKGDREKLIQDLVAKAKDVFFEKVPPQQLPPQSACSTARACFRLLYSQDTSQQTFSATVSEEDIATTKINLATWAILKAQTKAIGTFEGLGRGTSAPLGLAVQPGQAVKIHIDKIAVERRQRLFTAGQLEHELPGETLDTHITQINSCPGHHDRKSCDTWGCWWERVCNDPQDQGPTEFKMWFEKEFPRWDEVLEPIGKVPYNIAGELTIVATANDDKGNKHEVQCNLLRDFKVSGTMNEIVVVIDDTPSCPLFRKTGQSRLNLRLKNDVETGEQTIRRRVLIRKWNELDFSADRYEADAKFKPELKIFGRVSVPSLTTQGRPQEMR